jgi:diaminopimelate decarboxylase
MPVSICYALKANANQAVVRTLACEGAGADVVSEGELRLALAAGVPPARIVFAGVGKTAAEIGFALGVGIRQFNVESMPELHAIDAIAQAAGKRAPVAIRVNPDVDARTHAKITTGKSENKFGIDLAHALEAYALASRLPGVAATGFAVHIGSQLTSVEPYRAAFAKLADLVREARAAGHRVETLDLGGGLGIAYDGEEPPTFAAYAGAVRDTVAGLGCALICEPGRALVGNSGVLLARVLYVKEGVSRRFAILDAGMNDLIRPPLYDAYHAIVPVREPAPGAPLQPIDVVGPVCESADRFAAQRPLPPLAAGDLVAIRSAGAYAAAMASAYNGRPLVAEVLVRGTDFAIVRPRATYDEMVARDRLPPWLAPNGDSGLAGPVRETRREVA